MKSSNELPRILVIDAFGTASPIVDQIRTTGLYQITVAADLQTVPTFLNWEPSVVLLHVPDDTHAAEQAFACLQELKHRVPVVVVSAAAEMGPYLVAMTYGAFDYVTNYTPVEELLRILSTAVRWQQARAA